jgi:hypothetical protein
VADNDWQSAWVEVLPDLSDFRNRANPQIVSILSGAGDAGGRAATSSMGAVFGGSFFGTVLATLGTRIASSIAESIRVGVEAGIDFIQQSVSIATDLNESVNALNVSFGEASEGIQALGKQAAVSLGLSNVEFNALAVRFSAFAKQIVGEGGDITGLIDGLTTRGADFASVYNIQVADALTLFQSGLAGETEPLRRYGIDVSAATVAAFAYANGIAEQGKQLTQQQKIQAAYGTLMAQTAVVQGDFANTSDQLANQQRILAARFEDAQGRLGTALLPALTELANLANDELIPVLDELIAEVGPILAEALRDSVPAVRDLVLAIAPLIPDLVKLAVELLPPFVDLLIAASPALIELAESMASGAENLNALLAVFDGSGTIDEFFASVERSEGVLVEFQASILTTIANISRGIQDFLGGIGAGVQQAVSFLQSIPQSLAGAGQWLVNSGRALIQGFINGINQMTKPVRDAVNSVMSVVGGFFPRSPAKYGPFSGTGWEAVKSSGRALFSQFESGFGGELGGGVILPTSVGGSAALASSGGAAVGGFDPTSLARLLRDYAERDVTVDVDGVTVARASISGSARLTALGAS